MQVTELLLTLFRRCRLELFTALLLLRSGVLNLRFHRLPMLLLGCRVLKLVFGCFPTLLRGAIFYRRRIVIATIVITLGDLV